MSKVAAIYPLLHSDGTDYARDILARVAAQVEPILLRRVALGWHCTELREFFPENDNLLGMNVNRGAKIYLRLRPAGCPPKKQKPAPAATGSAPRTIGDLPSWLAFDSVLDTMLHELAHNSIGPHNASFNALWDELRKECEADIAANRGGSPQAYGGSKDSANVGVGTVYQRGAAAGVGGLQGSTGASWQGEGHRLGSRSSGAPTTSAARRAASASAADRRRVSLEAAGGGGGVRLGGRAPHELAAAGAGSLWNSSAWSVIRSEAAAVAARRRATMAAVRRPTAALVDLTVSDDEEEAAAVPAASGPKSTAAIVCIDIDDEASGENAACPNGSGGFDGWETDEPAVIAGAGSGTQAGQKRPRKLEAGCCSVPASVGSGAASAAAAHAGCGSLRSAARTITVIELDDDGNVVRTEEAVP